MTDVSLPGATDVLDDEEASRQAADANLAKELAEQLYCSWNRNARGNASVPIPPTTPASVLQDAIRRFGKMHSLCWHPAYVDWETLALRVKL